MGVWGGGWCPDRRSESCSSATPLWDSRFCGIPRWPFRRNISCFAHSTSLEKAYSGRRNGVITKFQDLCLSGIARHGRTLRLCCVQVCEVITSRMG
jgi:hypothetical protein